MMHALHIVTALGGVSLSLALIVQIAGCGRVFPNEAARFAALGAALLFVALSGYTAYDIAGAGRETTLVRILTWAGADVLLALVVWLMERLDNLVKSLPRRPIQTALRR